MLVKHNSDLSLSYYFVRNVWVIKDFITNRVKAIKSAEWKLYKFVTDIFSIVRNIYSFKLSETE